MSFDPLVASTCASYYLTPDSAARYQGGEKVCNDKLKRHVVGPRWATGVWITDF